MRCRGDLIADRVQDDPLSTPTAGAPRARAELSRRADPARYRAVPRRQYRGRVRHDLRQRRRRAACAGHRADPRQRDLRGDRARPAVPRRAAAAPGQADPGLRQCRRLSQLQPALSGGLALCRRGFQPAVGRGNPRRRAPIDRACARAGAAPVCRRRRFPARHPFDAARDRTPDAGRHRSTGRWRWRAGSASPS